VLCVCLCVLYVVRVDQIDRYKYVAVVHIGPTESTEIIIASRCLLKADFDTFASHSFNNQRLFAVATVYAFYREWRAVLRPRADETRPPYCRRYENERMQLWQQRRCGQWNNEFS